MNASYPLRRENVGKEEYEDETMLIDFNKAAICMSIIES
jgi:hypothetical protein